MSDTEGPRRYGEPKPVLPTLVAPTVADFEITREDYEKTPDVFKTTLLIRMLFLDNPGLVGVLREGLFEPDSDPAYRWAFIYYGTIERTAHNAEVAPLKIPVSVAKKYGEQHGQPIPRDISAEDARTGVEKYKADLEVRKAKDRAFSPGLSAFWDMVDGEMEILKAQGRDETRLLALLTRVYALQTQLQRQHELSELLSGDKPEENPKP